MPRPTPIAYDLSDAEKRDLIKLIGEGKTREVCTAILPFQTLEHIDEPRKEAAAEESGQQYDFVFVDQVGFEKHPPKNFAALATSFTEYK